ncbi:TlpA family protein disulfide reductase [Dinghuibacter silviterrae]|nr:hypothetical protein [Dinghuibacter silviterrae]
MKVFLSICMVLALAACRHKSSESAVLHLRGAFNRQYYVEALGLNGEKSTILDSGKAASNRDSIAIELPPGEERLFRVVFADKDIDILFVNDARNIDIFCNYGTGVYSFGQSPASTEWQDFQKDQAKCVASERYGRDLVFADTVRNPALFLAAYGMLDFGADYKGLDSFMHRAGVRFPRHQGIQTLVKATLEYTRLFENPLRVGDSVSELTLPDINGLEFSTYSITNKYILINFWSPLDMRSKPYLDAVEEEGRKMDGRPLAVLSVALDDRLDAWKNMVTTGSYSGVQLIDENIWKGPSVKAFRFDSIPFNFLIGPDKKVIAKGIPADSLQSVLHRFVSH